MSRFNSERDRTGSQRSPSTGLHPGRLCWTCKVPRQPEGGKTHARTRMWNCANCLKAKQ